MSVSSDVPLRAATRSSPLARWQTTHVSELMQAAAGESVEPLFVDTLGDRTQSLGTPLHEIGGRGVFSKEVQAAVLDMRADIAVHSAKDLPSQTVPGLVLAGVPARGDVRDVLIGGSLNSLPSGAQVGTSSVRRAAQLLSIRPDLRIVPIRGNVGTRIKRVGELDAVVLALTPLHRLGILDEVAEEHDLEVLDPSIMLPMVSQGALAVECRIGDARAANLCAAITDATTLTEVTTERAYLARLGGGCDLPVAALARVDHDLDLIHLDALLASDDGRTIIRRAASGRDPEALGTELAEEILASGGEKLLA